MSNAIRIHRHPLSGHAHRVELFASLAGINAELIDIDLASGEHKKPAFLELNPFGQVPTIEDGDIVLSDSNAILIYLARRYAPEWYGKDALREAEIQRFLSLAAGDIAFGPAAARLVNVFGAPLDKDRAKAVAERVFDRLEEHLHGRQWLVGDAPTIADIAIYSYTAKAPEGDISLAPYPNILRLLENVEGLPGFKPMTDTKVGLAA